MTDGVGLTGTRDGKMIDFRSGDTILLVASFGVLEQASAFTSSHTGGYMIPVVVLPG